MSLNLGLESLGISTEDVSLESVLASQIDAQDARSSFEHAMFDLATTARNVENFNEIVSSLEKHSSEACAAYAADLLGVPSVEAAKAKEVKIPLEKQSKVGKTLGNWAEKVKAFIKKCYAWVKKQIAKLTNKIGLTSELTRNPKVKVHWTAAQLSAMAKSLDAVDVAVTEKTLENLLKIKLFAVKPKGAVLDLKKDADGAYFNAMLGVQAFIYKVSTMVRTETNDKTSSTQLKYQSALLSRLQTVQKYVLADIKAISDASLGAAGKVTGKFASIQEQQKGLQEKLDESKKKAAEVK